MRVLSLLEREVRAKVRLEERSLLDQRRNLVVNLSLKGLAGSTDFLGLNKFNIRFKIRTSCTSVFSARNSVLEDFSFLNKLSLSFSLSLTLEISSLVEVAITKA